MTNYRNIFFNYSYIILYYCNALLEAVDLYLDFFYLNLNANDQSLKLAYLVLIFITAFLEVVDLFFNADDFEVEDVDLRGKAHDGLVEDAEPLEDDDNLLVDPLNAQAAGLDQHYSEGSPPLFSLADCLTVLEG